MGNTKRTKQRGGSGYKPMVPKPVVVAAFQPGCSTAQCSAHKLQLNRDNAQNELNNPQNELNNPQNELNNPQHGGDAQALAPAPIACPQVAMHGMQATPNNSNQQSCEANGTQSQSHANAQYDNLVGKLPPKTQSGGIVHKRKRRTHKRKIHKRRTHKRRTHKRRTHKRRTHKRR